MRISRRAPRGAVFLALAVATALLLAACGGSSSTNASANATTSQTSQTSATRTASQASAGTALTAFRACLKSHGLTLPGGGFGGRPPGGFGAGTGTEPTGAPPTGGGYGGGAGGSGGGFGRGFAGANPKFATAFRDCAAKLPAGSRFGRFGRGGFGAGGAARRPQFSAKTLDAFVACIRKNGYPQMPNPNTSGTGGIFPRSVQTNASFEAASKKCASILVSGFGGAAPGAGGAPAGAAPSASPGTATTSST